MGCRFYLANCLSTEEDTWWCVEDLSMFVQEDLITQCRMSSFHNMLVLAVRLARYPAVTSSSTKPKYLTSLNALLIQFSEQQHDACLLPPTRILMWDWGAGTSLTLHRLALG